MVRGLTLMKAFSFGASGTTKCSKLACLEVGGVFCGEDGCEIDVRCMIVVKKNNSEISLRHNKLMSNGV